jgi:DNA-binding MarR family transcriptional regulator
MGLTITCVAQTSSLRNDVESALSVMRTMAAIADSSLATVTELTLTQYRALLVVVDRAPVAMSVVARELGMNPSSVSRAGDRLVTLKLVRRDRNPLNRRETLLTPTAAGRRVVDRVRQDRRELLATILDRLDPDSRAAVTAAFEVFRDAAAAS